MNISLSPFAPENLVSRDGFGRPVPRQRAHSLLVWSGHVGKYRAWGFYFVQTYHNEEIIYKTVQAVPVRDPVFLVQQRKTKRKAYSRKVNEYASFFGLATKTLNVRNVDNNRKTPQGIAVGKSHEL